MALDVHVVTHTHWDREWYHPVERFRQRLVALVDEVLDHPPTGDSSFLLDGQAIVLEDYLAVRPERADELRALLSARRLEAGPWFVLADELIPSGEAIVRNLFTGRRILARLRAQSPPVLYCPDSFGHPAALPAIAAGFGLPLIVLWRGYGGARWSWGDTVRWIAPGGDQALVFHLPKSGYEFGSHLPGDRDGAAARWQSMRAELVPRSTTGVMLVPNGADHHAPQRDLNAAVVGLETAGEADGVHRSSLRAFASALVERASAQRLPSIRGELRDSYGYTWALQGTFATRAHEKRMNAAAERALLREAEPWAALAAFLAPTRKPLLDAAWRTLLEAHPHDTLCGCSIDDVASAMELRVRSAMNQAYGIRDDAILDLLAHDPVEARTARDRWQPVVLVRNPVARARSGVAIIEIEEFIADVPVGPGSAPGAAAKVPPRGRPTIPSLGPLQLLSRDTENRLTESPRHYPDNDLVNVTRVAAWVSEVPGYGVSAHPIGAGEGKRRRPLHTIRVDGLSMSNGLLRVAIADDGSVSFEEADSGRRLGSLFDFVDESDVGDSYTPAPRPRSSSIVFRGARRLMRGPLRGTLEARYRILDGKRLIADVALQLTLDAEARTLRVALHGENRDTDHRVRLRFNLDVAAPAVWADAAFGPIHREPIVAADVDKQVEIPPATAPLHRYVSLFNESGGATIISDGLAEYEATNDGAVLVTVVRGIGELSRNDLPERPGHAGWPRKIPAAQCLGRFAAEFGVFLHGPRLAPTIDAIERAAEDVLLPLEGMTLRSALRTPPTVHGPELRGVGLAMSAIRESEDGEWLVLRCINLRDDDVEGAWELPFEPRRAAAARLDETVITELVPNGSTVPFRAGPRAIVTILVH